MHEFTALYLSCRNDLIAYLSQMLHCKDTAEDIAQESFIILSHSASQAVIDHPRGFLFRTAGNLAVDYIRHNKVVTRYNENESLITEEPPHQASPEQELLQAEWLALLKKTISDLPPQTRNVFILHKIRGLSYREVAAMLDISESAVEKHISKGLKRCRTQLGKHFQSPYAKDWGNKAP